MCECDKADYEDKRASFIPQQAEFVGMTCGVFAFETRSHHVSQAGLLHLSSAEVIGANHHIINEKLFSIDLNNTSQDRERMNNIKFNHKAGHRKQIILIFIMLLLLENKM